MVRSPPGLDQGTCVAAKRDLYGRTGPGKREQTAWPTLPSTSSSSAPAPAATSPRSGPRSSASRPRSSKNPISAGICLNWGCIPTKALLRSAEIYHYMQHAGDYGLSAEKVSYDPKAVVAALARRFKAPQ